MHKAQHARAYPSPLWGRVARVSAPGWGSAMPHSAISKQTRARSRALRHKPTGAERKLWFVFRSLKPLGVYFRRQASIGAYIADFVWHTGKLVVELDGSQYAQTRVDYDGKRTAWLESQGYRVLRFWNNDVLKTPRRVGEAILAAAQKAPPLTSPHKGERNRLRQAART